MSGWAALVLTVGLVLRSLLGGGAGLPRWDVVLLGAGALLGLLGWVRYGSAACPKPGAVPEQQAPPARLPVRYGVIARRLLLGWLIAFVPAVYADLALRPDGADARRISAIQDAGPRAAAGTLVAVEHLTKDGRVNKHNHYSGDAVVRVPGPDGAPLELSAPGAHLGTIRTAGGRLTVLYAPGNPVLGAYVDQSDDVAKYATGGFWAGPSTAAVGLGMVPLGGGFFVLYVLLISVRPETRIRVLRADARDGGLPAVRARVVGAVREEYVTVGSTPGVPDVRTTRWLRVECEDGTELRLDDWLEEVERLRLPDLAGRLAGEWGWLCGARRWRLISGDQPVALCTDGGLVLWGRLDRAAFESALGDRAEVTPAASRRVRLLGPPSPALRGAHGPWLALLAAAWLLALPVLLTASTWLLSMALCALSAGSLVAALVVLTRRRVRVADRDPGWLVERSGDPALG
ncbi:hypothetical protein ACFQ0T_08720 [Kitasatospora gansuensis]